MPAFTAIALDSLIEPGGSRPINKPPSHSRPPPNPKPITTPKLNRRHSISSGDKKAQCLPINPELYATPEATPLPDSHTSFVPSPYIVNHKRRGPRLSKSVSEIDVAACRKALDDQESCSSENKKTVENEVVSSANKPSVINSVSSPREKKEKTNDDMNSRVGSKKALQINSDGKVWGGNLRRVNTDVRYVSNKFISGFDVGGDSPKRTPKSSKKGGATDDFFDPQDSLNYTSNSDEEQSNNNNNRREYPSTSATIGEFYDAWDGKFKLFVLFIES